MFISSVYFMNAPLFPAWLEQVAPVITFQFIALNSSYSAMFLNEINFHLCRQESLFE